MKNLLAHRWSVCFRTEECLLMARGSQKKTKIKHINLNLSAAFQLAASRRDSRCFVWAINVWRCWAGRGKSNGNALSSSMQSGFSRRPLESYIIAPCSSIYQWKHQRVTPADTAAVCVHDNLTCRAGLIPPFLVFPLFGICGWKPPPYPGAAINAICCN